MGKYYQDFTFFKDNRVLMSRNYRSDRLSLENLMFLKLPYLPRSFASRANIRFKNMKFSRDNYQPIAPRQKHSIMYIN